MRPMIRLACGLAAGTLLLLTCASVAFAADPLLTIDGPDETSSDAAVVATTGTSRATVRLSAGSRTTTADRVDGNATVTLGAGAPTSDGDTDGSAMVTLGAGAPTSDGDTDGSATVTLGAGAPTTVGDPASTVGALSSGFASLMAFGGSVAEDTTGDASGSVPGESAIDEAVPAMSSLFGLLAFGGTGVTPSDPGGSAGSGAAAAAPSDTGGGVLPETSTEALVAGLGVGFPTLALVLGLLVGGLMARRRSVWTAN